MAFKRTVEDFVCEKCGTEVRGNGYTNHCPSCLWSKHVDVQPGDRAAACRGAMEPVGIEGSTPSYRIVHRCIRCAAVRVNDVEEGDSTEAIIGLSAHPRRS